MSDLGSWAGLYHSATEKLMRERMAAEKDVLQVLANRANPLGFCWPGTGYIAQMIGRMDATVENALRRLELMDFIRISRTQNLIRNRIDVDFQVSPYVLFISPDKLPLAIELWEQNRNVGITNEIKESQPTTGTILRQQTPLNQHHNQQQQQTAFLERKASDESPNPASQISENANAKTDSSGAAATPPTAATPQSPNPSPVPQPPSPLITFPDPLPDEAAEQIAAEMNAKTRYMMSMATARGLIERYGLATCEAALLHMSRCTKINSPAGFLRATIESAGVDPVADGKIPVEEADGDAFKNSKYADYYKTDLYNDGEYARFIHKESDDE